MSASSIIKSLCCLLLLMSLAGRAQLVKVPTDGTDLAGTPAPPPSPTSLLPDHDAADRMQAQIKRFGGPPSESDKLAMLRSFLQQKQTYGPQFAGAAAAKGTPAWRSIGPTSAKYESNAVTLKVSDSGRVRTILQSPTDEDTVYVLASGGGLWKTTTFTHTNPQWQPKTDALLSTSGGSVAFGRSPSTLYLGLGDPFDFFPHLGGFVTRSDDGGDTWTALATVPGAWSIRDIKVDTSGPSDVILVSTDVGLFRSTDGGATFSQVASVPGQEFWSIVKTSAGWLASAAGGQLMLSTDRGATWSVTGSSLAGAGRATLAVARPGDAVVYAIAATPDGSDQDDLFRSDDGGLNWIELNITNKVPVNANFFQPNMDILNGQAWYNQLILVDPADKTHRTVYLGGQLATAKTQDGGATWTLISTWLPFPSSPSDNLPYVHADCHFATMGTIRGTNTVMFGTDGGIFISQDAGATWDFSKNDGIVSHLSQTIAVSAKNPQSVVTGMQDDGSRARLGSSDVYNQIWGGDGEGVGWSQANNDFTLVSNPGGITSLSGLLPNTKANPVAQIFTDAFFYTPIATPSAVLDPTGQIFLSAVNIGLISTGDGGNTWYWFARIGRRIPAGFTFREGWNFIGLNNPGPDGIAVAGTQGRVAISMDYVHYHVSKALCPSPNCVAGFQGYITAPVWAPGSVLYLASESPIPGSVRIVRSADQGATWQAAGNGLPDAPVYSLAADFRDASGNTMYAGTNIGVYVTRNGGASWTLFGSGMPTTPVTSLAIDPAGSVLRAAVYGRGIWEIKP